MRRNVRRCAQGRCRCEEVTGDVTCKEVMYTSEGVW